MSTATQTRFLSRTQAIDLLEAHRSAGRGRIFSVTFSKRSDGTIRKIVGRFRVTANRKGGQSAYDASKQALMIVFDMHEQGYRSINLIGLKSLRIDGKAFTVK